MPRYAGDPRWIEARYPGKCAGAGCGAAIPKKARAYYFPKGRILYCTKCGEQKAAEFAAAAADEDNNYCL